MINHLNVEKLAETFTGFFIDLNFNDKLKDITFIEILLGFMYAHEKILKSVELIGVCSSQQINQIKEILCNTASESLESNSKLCEMLNQIKSQIKEEKDGGEG